MVDLSNEIICGKFDNKLYGNSWSTNKINRIRIFSVHPNKRKSWHYTPISTNGKLVAYEGEVYTIDAFDRKKLKHKSVIVLTEKEKKIFLASMAYIELDISVLENKFPIFDDVKYVDNVLSSYSKLKEKLKLIAKKGWKGKSLSAHFSVVQKYKIERKVRYKNDLDYFFYFACNRGYQEVFKFKEERIDRVVVAFDFNSMYASCMAGDFLEPKSIKYKKLEGLSVNYKLLPMGLYRVILKAPKNTFFKKFHPFKYQKFNKSFYFSLDEEQSVEALIFKEELDYYKDFFESFELIEMFYSPKKIKHPLYKDAVRIYKERSNFKKFDNKLHEKVSKLNLLTMHSATNPNKNLKIKFTRLADLLSYLEDNYAINFGMNLTSNEKLHLISSHYKFMVTTDSKGEWILHAPNVCNSESIYSISSKILSNARLKLLKTIERFLRHRSVEICYSNIDSIHISIQKNELDDFLNDNQDIISDRFGDLKVQSITDSGYWFDVGRYWLLNNNQVIQYKNIIFNNKFSPIKFEKYRKINQVVKGEMFNYSKVIYSSIENSFSYSKKLTIDKVNFERYSFSEIKDLTVAGDTYCNEILLNKLEKISLFDRLATDECY